MRVERSLAALVSVCASTSRVAVNNLAGAFIYIITRLCITALDSWRRCPNGRAFSPGIAARHARLGDTLATGLLLSLLHAEGVPGHL